MSIQKFFDNAVQALTVERSSALGDRSVYIGASDIGVCPRKVVLGKQQPKKQDTRTLMRFARGHLAEEFLDSIFRAGGATYDRQAAFTYHGDCLRAHVDFLFLGKESLHVVEAKSVHAIPDEPYSSWVDQLYFQLGMVQEQYPSSRVSGSILAVDLNAGEVHEYNGFAPQEEIFAYLVSRGLYLLDCLAGKDDPRTETGILCGSCSYRNDCPAFATSRVEIPGEVEMMARKYVGLSEMKNKAEKELKSIKQEILTCIGEKFKGNNGSISIVVSSIGPSETVDGKLLQQKFPDVYRQVLKAKAGFTKIDVRELQHPIQPAI